MRGRDRPPARYRGGMSGAPPDAGELDPARTAHTSSRPPASGARRVVLLSLGSVSLGAGVVGAFVPLVPTVPFLLLATWAFARSDPRLERWLVEHPRLGPPVVRWREHGVISRRAKVGAGVVIGASAAAVGATAAAVETIAVSWLALGGVVTFIWTRPSEPRA